MHSGNAEKPMSQVVGRVSAWARKDDVNPDIAASLMFSVATRDEFDTAIPYEKVSVYMDIVESTGIGASSLMGFVSRIGGDMDVIENALLLWGCKEDFSKATFGDRVIRSRKEVVCLRERLNK